MVNVIICGPAGAGKSSLINRLRETCGHRLRKHSTILDVATEVLHYHRIRCREDFRCSDTKYIDVHKDIIERQFNEEKSQCGQDFITDNCIINAFVLLDICVGKEVVESILEISDTKEIIERYKGSLIVFVGPLRYDYDDQKCLKISQEQWSFHREVYLKYFRRFHIPILELKSHVDEDRIFKVKRYLEGILPLESSVQNIYDKKFQDKNKIVPTNFLFHLRQKRKENCISIPTIMISEHFSEQNWTTYTDGETSRFIIKEGYKHLMCLQFDINIQGTVVQKMLLGDVYINGSKYSFLGCSGNGLKSRKCFMYKGSTENVEEILGRHGEFNNIKTVSKRISRIGLLFSAVTPTEREVKDEDIIMNDDIVKCDTSFIFTDGCGAIGKGLAKELAASLVKCIDGNYIPSVYQVRFQGYKGVLALDINIPEKAIMLRPSMKKFDTQHHPYLGLCNYSKPYTFGHLNKQFIMLLSGLGIKDEIFEKKQAEHFSALKNMLTKSETAIQILQWQNMFDMAQEINNEGGIEYLSEEKKTMCNEQLKQLQTKMVSKIEKLHILIPKSRNIFGVCDPCNVLDYGECFLRLTISGKPKTIRNQVVVCKNPCYLLGDVRVLTAISDLDKPKVKNLNHLVDCIVFPTRGKRPHPNEIAGSDLDGDTFFVTWDEHLIPKSIKEPYDYPGTVSKPEGKITHEKIIAYFSRQNETQKLIGRVDRYFNSWADLNGPGSSQCELLGQLFSKVIDSGKTGENIDIHKGLQIQDPLPVELETKSKTFVWVKLLRLGNDFKERFQEEVILATNETGNVSDFSEEFVFGLAREVHSNISEFQKFQFLWTYECRLGLSQEETFDHFKRNFADHIQFSHFTFEERKYALEKAGFPLKILLNDLNLSKILLADELSFFQMNSPLNTWRKYITLEHSFFYWGHLLKALTTNDYNLIVFKLPGDVVLELQILEKLAIGTEQPVSPGTITGLLYSRNFDYKFKYILGNNYVLDLTEDTFQLYRNLMKNRTFVWLNATDRKQVHGRWNKSLCDEISNALSVDLQRFDRKILDQSKQHPHINKTPFEMIEIYAQSCTKEVPYWDIYDANDLLPVEEEMIMSEMEEINTFKVDFESVFPEIESQEELSTEEELTQRLNEISSSGNPFAFKSLLDKWLPRTVPYESVFPFIEMLNNFIAKVVPDPVVPDKMKNVILEVSRMMSKVLITPQEFLMHVSALFRLGIENDNYVTILAQLSSAEYLEVLQSWQCFVYMDIEAAVSFAEKLNLSWVTALGQEKETVTDWTAELHEYVRNKGILHLMNLIVEIHENMIEYRQTTTEKPTCISFLKVDTTADNDQSKLFLYKTGATSQKASRFKGQHVIVSEQYRYVKRIICIGQIETISTAPCMISLKICGKKPDIFIYAEKSEARQYLRIDLIGNLVIYQRVIKAFRDILSWTEMSEISTKIIQPCHLEPIEENAVTDVESNICAIEHLNKSQVNAVKNALTRKVSMIVGPPGTGKTEVACHIVRSILGVGKYKCILVVAETNVAVDNLTRRLRNYASIVRVGPIEGVDSDLYDVSLEGQMALISEKEAKRLNIHDQQGISHNNRRLANKVLAAADVILTTCSGAGDVQLENCTFPFVLIDEATQTLETTLLCSLTRGASHIVLIGDNKQLGPVIKNFPKEYISPNLPDLGELSETLFHRWLKKIPYTFLDVQYRMHADIMKFPSEEFYDNKLTTASSIGRRSSVVFPWPTGKPLCFVNVNGKERKLGTSYYNEDEIKVVKRVIDVLLNVEEETHRNKRLAVYEIGVITMYQAQVHELKQYIKKDMKISTVDGFQGQEKDVIVVSTVRSNEKNSLGFSDDPKRLNVMFTRAKRGLIVIGNKTTLMASSIWAKWLQNAPVLDTDVIIPTGEQQVLVREQQDEILYQRKPMNKKSKRRK